MNKLPVYAAVFAIACSQAMAAVEFSATMSSGPRDKSVTRGLVDGPNARIEFAEGSAGGIQKGSYMLTRDGGSTITLVNPKEKSYMKIDPEQMAATAGQFMNATKGFMSMSFKDPKVETLSDEKGPAILGMPTRQVKTRTSYTVETSVFGNKSASQVTREEEIYVTQKLNDKGFNLFTKQRSIKTGNADIDKLMALESAKINGFPLKMISKNINRDAKGREEITSTTYEVTELKQTSAPKGSFDIPEGYKDSMAELGAEMRKAQKEAAAEDNDEGGEAGAATEAVNSLMKGLFGGGKR